MPALPRSHDFSWEAYPRLPKMAAVTSASGLAWLHLSFLPTCLSCCIPNTPVGSRGEVGVAPALYATSLQTQHISCSSIRERRSRTGQDLLGKPSAKELQALGYLETEPHWKGSSWPRSTKRESHTSDRRGSVCDAAKIS